MLGVRHNTNGFIYCPLYVGSWRGVLSATRLIDCSVPSVFTIFQFNDIIFHYCMHDYDDDDDDGCYIDLVYSLTFQIAFGAEPLASKIIPFHFTTLPFPAPTAQYYIIAYHLLNIHLRPLTSSLPQPITIDESLAERQVHAEEEAFFESGGDGFSPTSQRDDYAAVNTASSLMMMSSNGADSSAGIDGATDNGCTEASALGEGRKKSKRRPRSCKTCGHAYGPKINPGADTASIDYHVWDVAANKFAECRCPPALYHESIKRRRKGGHKENICHTCQNPVWGANFKQYHVDPTTHKRSKCTFQFSSHHPSSLGP
mmetsp:Transcript_21061/g.31752  ORF Transcript_21061/g.31752 Transcript_21061/m.31752 type:complete len:314 (-) Transcript_21061:285-1226(-)